MRFPSINQRRCRCLIALLLCALPAVCRGEVLEPELVFPSSQIPDLPSSAGTPPPILSTQAPQQPSELVDLQPDHIPLGSELSAAEFDAAEHGDPFGYNLRKGNTAWLIGGGDHLGIVSLESLPTLSPGEKSGIVVGTGFHFLNGPIQTDLPPRLFDFQLGYQRRRWISPSFGYDVAARVGVFSDFEGSAREGVRFPSHAVTFYRWGSALETVLGVEYLDRDDIHMLPVFGLIYKPRADLRFDLVFPRPRVEVQVSPTTSLYLAGELGGGTWAIERVTQTNDVVTYRDLRLLFGLSARDAEGREGGIEVGYVFSRELSYRSGVGDFAPGSAVLIRFTERY